MNCINCGNPLESFNRFCPKCGAPAPPQYQPPSPSSGYVPPQTPVMGGPIGPPQRKSSCGKVLLIIAAVLVIIGIGIAAAIYFGYRYAEKTLKASEAYTTAVTTLKENSDVRDKLGEISDTGFPIGAFSQNADGSGDAAFTMSVQGTKGTGQYGVQLKRRNSVWKVENGNLRLANGDIIQVANSMPTAIEENSNTNSNTPSDSPGSLTPGKPISGGVLNGKAISLPKPAYPPAAKAVKASGTVVVQVEIDEQGKVVSAKAVSGHPLLRSASEAAAREARFTPTKLSGKPVKVSGVVTYNFVSE